MPSHDIFFAVVTSIATVVLMSVEATPASISLFVSKGKYVTNYTRKEVI